MKERPGATVEERGESGGLIWASVRGGGQEDFPEQVTAECYRVNRC